MAKALALIVSIYHPGRAPGARRRRELGRDTAHASIRMAQLAWMARPLTAPYRMALLIALIVVVVGACGSVATVPSPTPSAVPSLTPGIGSLAPATIDQGPPSPSQRRAEMIVAGTAGGASPLRLTVVLPASWTPHDGPFAADRGTAHPPDGISF